MHKYDEYLEYHHVVYHMLLRSFLLFWQGDYSNSEYKNGVLFGNSPGATTQEITILVLNADTEVGVEKTHMLARGKYLATEFLLRSEMRRYEELILSLKNDYAKQQRN